MSGACAHDTTGDATVSLTTTATDSFIVSIAADWAATDGATRTWATINSVTPTSGNGLERLYFRDASYYTIYSAYWTAAGATGAKTVGVTDPDSASFNVAAIEVKP